MSERRSVVVTGASTGIGRAAAKALVQQGLRVFGSVRKPEDAQSLTDEFGGEVVPLRFDVTEPESISNAASYVEQALEGTTLAGLVNNAGIALAGSLMHQPIDDLRQQFEVNVFGLMAVTQAFLPLLGARRDPPGPPGRVVNLSSVGGRIAYPFMGAYSASKHALEALSDSLRRELMIYGVDVIVVEPGAVKTPIWEKAEDIDISRYEGTDYAQIIQKFKKMMLAQGRAGLQPSRVGEVIADAITTARPKARYAIPDQPWIGWRIPRLLPDRWIDKAVAQQVGLQRIDEE